MKRVFMIGDCTCTDERLTQYAILEEEPKAMLFCECYSEYGIQIGCNDAGCTALENYYSREEVLDSIMEILGMTKESGNSFEENLELCKAHPDFESVRKSIEDRIEVKGYEFFNGRNWETLITEDEAGMHSDLLAVEEELEKSILAEYKDLEGRYDQDDVIETANYIFHSFNMKRKIYLAIVEKK